MQPERGFAVIDFETTGLSPARSDRALEIAVVHVSPRGEITGVWDTLINPERDVGAQHIHRITRADVAGAPTFDLLAGTLARLLDGRVMVAHNAGFDLRFLTAEFARTGYTVPIAESDCVCTMKLASVFLPGSRRNLATCCERFGIDLTGAHRASVDAVATATLLARYIEQAPAMPLWDDQLDAAAARRWPDFPGASTPWYPRPDHDSVMPEAEDHFLKRLAEDLSPGWGSRAGVPVAVLDGLRDVLSSRSFGEADKTHLDRTAEGAGVVGVEYSRLLRAYFEALVEEAAERGGVSPQDHRDLVRVGRFLRIDLTEIDERRAQL